MPIKIVTNRAVKIVNVILFNHLHLSLLSNFAKIPLTLTLSRKGERVNSPPLTGGDEGRRPYLNDGYILSNILHISIIKNACIGRHPLYRNKGLWIL